MKAIKFLSILLLAIILLNSCSAFEKKSEIKRQKLFTGSQGTLFWANYDATKRGSMIFVEPNGKVRVLAENPPDAAIQSITSITTKFKKGEEIDANLVFETSKSIAELGKKTASVNMLRDALYRLNEIYYATKDERDETKKLLNKALDKDISAFNTLLSNNSTDNKIITLNELSSNDLKDLFQLIINNAKEMNIEEANASVKIEESKSKSNIEESKKKIIQLELLKEIYEKSKDSLTNKEQKEYLDKILKF